LESAKTQKSASTPKTSQVNALEFISFPHLGRSSLNSWLVVGLCSLHQGMPTNEDILDSFVLVRSVRIILE
jgi:hypothetical protein